MGGEFCKKCLDWSSIVGGLKGYECKATKDERQFCYSKLESTRKQALEDVMGVVKENKGVYHEEVRNGVEMIEKEEIISAIKGLLK